MLWVVFPSYGIRQKRGHRPRRLAAGNAAPITGEVTAIREETIGTVRHPDGTVDVAHSYSQWDVDNGYWPRCFRRDIGHFSVPRAEYLSHLLAARIKELGW